MALLRDGKNRKWGLIGKSGSLWACLGEYELSLDSSFTDFDSWESVNDYFSYMQPATMMFYLPAGRGTLNQVNMADEYKTESKNKSFLLASFSLAFYHHD